MFTHYRSEGLILKKIDRGEANQLLTIYTKDFGKLEILGKAIRKISSKLRAGAEVFYLSEIEFIQGKNYKTLTDAVLINKFPDIQNNLNGLKTAHLIARMTDKLVKGEEPDGRLWRLLRKTFQVLNSHSLSVDRYSLIYYYFLWNFFSLLGYCPQLQHCSLCQNKLNPERVFFNLKEGGLVCDKCSKKQKDSKKIHQDVVKILRLFLGKDWEVVKNLKILPLDKKALEDISQDYLSDFIKE
mgnify:CR=1 FL=1